MNNSKKKRTVSVKLDTVTDKKLAQIMKARDVDQSEAIRLCINGAKILQIGNARDLGLEFCRIRNILETGQIDDEIKGRMEALCQSICVLLQKVEN